MSSLKEVFSVLSSMQKDGVILDYAIGGAIASLFYVEATRTYDLDIFAIIPNQTGLLIDLSNIYTWASKKGFKSDKEHIIIYNTPVQIISANEGLEKESVENAILFDYEGINVKVIKSEYLVALYSKAGGEKRKARIALLREKENFNNTLLNDIINKYNIKVI